MSSPYFMFDCSPISAALGSACNRDARIGIIFESFPYMIHEKVKNVKKKERSQLYEVIALFSLESTCPFAA